MRRESIVSGHAQGLFCWRHRLDGASDHGVSEALYLRDPDENGVELYWDRPREQWPRDKDGAITMKTERLDLEDLLAELEKAPA